MASVRPRESVVRQLFAVSMNRCAFPGCQTPIVDPGTKAILGEVCHIRAKNVGGSRYDAKQTDEDRHASANLILMCSTHHTLVDNPQNSTVYTVAYLVELKRKHEEIARASTASPPMLTDEQVRLLIATVTEYSSGALHMDFREAVFQVGGQGGTLGGGGGGGGILTIVGTTRHPDESPINLAGSVGEAPGGGGGGGGSLLYIGRPVNGDDLDHGLRLSSFFPANAAYHDGLIHVLGAGWEYFDLSKCPTDLRINLVAFVELGSIAPDSLLQLEFSARNPGGQDVASVACDVAVPSAPGLTPRAVVTALLTFHVADVGVWTFRASSSTHELGVYRLEMRPPRS